MRLRIMALTLVAALSPAGRVRAAGPQKIIAALPVGRIRS